MIQSRSLPNINVNLSDVVKGKDLLGHQVGQKRVTKIVGTVPTPASDQLVVSALSYGSQSRPYTLSMVLQNIKFADTRTANCPIKISSSGKSIYCSQISMNTGTAQVRCTCQDFYFTWSHWNNKNKVLTGPSMPKYNRKTTNWPERNSAHVPGMCKHLIELTQKLKQLNIIRG